MTWPWVVVIAGVAVAASLTMVAVAGFLRRAISALEVFESRLRSGASAGLNLGLSPGSVAEPFDLETSWGERVAFPDFIDRPTVLLLMSAGCSACKALARKLPAAGIEGVPLYVVLPVGTDADWVREGVGVLYQDRDSASRALQTTFTPHAFVVGVGGPCCYDPGCSSSLQCGPGQSQYLCHDACSKTTCCAGGTWQQPCQYELPCGCG